MKPVISQATFVWMAALLPEGQRELLAAEVDIYFQEPPAPPVELDRERLAADVDRIRREQQPKPDGATPVFTAVDETRGWAPKKAGKSERYRRDLKAWADAHEAATGRRPDTVTAGQGEPVTDRAVFDYDTWAAEGWPEPAWEWAVEWTAAPDHISADEFRRFYLNGVWPPPGPDEPTLKPYRDAIDRSVKRLAQDTGIPEVFLRY